MSHSLPDHPPTKPCRRSVSFEQNGSVLSLRYRNREWGAGVFLCLWLCGWTVGCVFLAWQVWVQPQLFLIVFAVPFWAGWFLGFFQLLKMFVQCEEFRLDDDGVTYRKRIVVLIEARQIPLAELNRFESSETTHNTKNDQPECYVELITPGQPLRMTANLSDDERRWLVWSLNQHLQRIRPQGMEPDDAVGSAIEQAETEPMADVAPSDCSWRLADSLNDVEFVQSGKLLLSHAFGALFLNLFWNGAVSVFVMVLLGFDPNGQQLQGAAWWGLFFFLSPFEAIGLVMFGGLVGALLEPIRRTTWRFGSATVAYQQSWLNIGPRWRYDAASVTRVELRIGDAAVTKPKFSLNVMQRTTSSQDIRLILIDASNTEIVSVTNLTEGEARWMLNVLRKQRPEWFREV